MQIIEITIIYLRFKLIMLANTIEILKLQIVLTNKLAVWQLLINNIYKILLLTLN